jgi:hypothetical protein
MVWSGRRRSILGALGGKAKLSDICFAKGMFVAIGSGNGLVITSTDGRQWIRQTPEVGGGLEIIHDGREFVVLAAGGFLSTSVDGVAWEYCSFPLQAISQVYQFQAAADCVSWNPVATVTCTANPMNVKLSEQNGASRWRIAPLMPAI